MSSGSPSASNRLSFSMRTLSKIALKNEKNFCIKNIKFMPRYFVDNLRVVNWWKLFLAQHSSVVEFREFLLTIRLMCIFLGDHSIIPKNKIFAKALQVSLDRWTNLWPLTRTKNFSFQKPKDFYEIAKTSKMCSLYASIAMSRAFACCHSAVAFKFIKNGKSSEISFTVFNQNWVFQLKTESNRFNTNIRIVCLDSDWAQNRTILRQE